MTIELKLNDSSLPLRQDVKLLGKMLGEILLNHGGSELLDKVEKIRLMCKTLREHFDQAIYDALKEEITSLRRTYEETSYSSILHVFSFD